MINTNYVALQFILCLSLYHLHLLLKSLSYGTLFEHFTSVSNVEWLLLLNPSVPRILETFLIPLLEKYSKVLVVGDVGLTVLILGPIVSKIR